MTAGVTRQKLTFAYDYLGRRVSKRVQSGWNGSTYTTTDLSLRYLYDGWSLLFEFDAAASLAKVRAHVWGLDVSGTLQGAGGVGGLLGTYDFSSSSWYLPAYDALGNIHGMIKASDGSLAAAYEYDAFGNTLRESGPYAASNPFRFATKYADLETGLVQYNTRYYSPTLGRFLNRDTISEQGGLNLYAYCGNNGVNHWDYLGNVFDGIHDGEGFASADHMDYSKSGTSSGAVGGGVWGGNVFVVEESLVSLANRIMNAAFDSIAASNSAFGNNFSAGGIYLIASGSTNVSPATGEQRSVPEIPGVYDGYGKIGETEFLGWSYPTAVPPSPSSQTFAPKNGDASSAGLLDQAGAWLGGKIGEGAHNFAFLVGYIAPHAGANVTYGPGSREVEDMRVSPGADVMRDRFYANGGQTTRNIAYTSGRAWFETLLDPRTADWASTAAQVGGFGGASVLNNGNGSATFTIPNLAGTKSFFYHAVPDVPDHVTYYGPFAPIRQTFTWTEPIDSSRLASPPVPGSKPVN